MNINDKVKGAYYGWFFGPGAILRKTLEDNYASIKKNPNFSKVKTFEEIPSDYKMYDQLTQTQIVHDIILANGIITPELFRDKLLELNKRDSILDNEQYGPSTQSSVKALLKGDDPRQTGKNGVTTGGAMRCLPISLYFRNDLGALIKQTYNSCIISHNTDVAVSSAMAVNLMAYFLLKEKNQDKALDSTLDILEKSYGKYGNATSFAYMHKRIRDAVEWVKDKSFEEATEIIATKVGFSWYAIEGIPAGFALYFATQNAKEAGLMAFKIGYNHTAPQIACAFHGAEKGSNIFPRDIMKKIEKTNSINIDKMVSEIIDKTN